MPKLDPTLWRDMMEYLRQRHAAICRQWFEDLEPVELHSGLLKVHTSNTVQRNYLQKKCLEQFTEAAQATTGALVAVRFVTEDAPAIYDEEAAAGMSIGTATEEQETPGEPGAPGALSVETAVAPDANPDTVDLQSPWHSPTSDGDRGSDHGRHGTPPRSGEGLDRAMRKPGNGHATPQRAAGLTPTVHTTQTLATHGAVAATVTVATPPGSSSTRGQAANAGTMVRQSTATLTPALSTAPAGASAAPRAVPRAATRPTPQPQYLGGADDPAYDQIVISPDYSFDNFVTGPGNELAYAASVAVANQPGTAYNPLFIHGGVGLGKTHLLQAICQTIIQKQPALRLCYLSCDSFINQFIDCVQSGKMNEFRHRYRHVDVLVIDDIHFLANRERTQEEFFHTFNALYQSKRQIILSSDSPPAEIPQLEERLISRFQWGLVAHVSKPCYETRVAIIRAKAKLRGMAMPDDVIAYIAEKIDSNARELEGAINTIQGHAVLQNRPIDLGMAQSAMGDSALQSSGAQVTLHNIVIAVTSFYSVKLSDLQSKRRHKSITGPRQVCMWLARKRTRFSLEEIGIYFGGRDHTTVMHSIKTVDGHMTRDPSFAAQIEKIAQHISKIQATSTVTATPG